MATTYAEPPVTDDRTQYADLALPSLDNVQEQDVPRLREALVQLDELLELFDVVLSGKADATALQALSNALGALSTVVDGKLPLAGGTLTGPLLLAGDPTQDLHPATRRYVDEGAGGRVRRRAITAADTAVVGDRSRMLDCSGLFPLNFATAALLGTGWWAWVRNSGTRIVTLTAAAGSTINGGATVRLFPGELVLVVLDGTALHVTYPGTNMRTRPIFDAETAGLQPVSDFGVIENAIVLPYNGVIAPTSLNLASNGTVALCGGSSNAASIPSTTDGRTWALRTMPAAAAWRPLSDGSGFVAYASTAVAVSADGTSFASGGALPGAPVGNVHAAIPGRYLVRSNTASQLYLSVNNGGAWTTETAPNTAVNLWACGGLFVAQQAGSTYYTSATGTTGSWTTRTLPGGAGNVTQQPDGSLIAWTNSNAWRSTDGINWTDLGPIPQAGGALLINGVLLNLNAAAGSLSYTRHAGGKWQARRVEAKLSTNFASCVKVGNAHLIGFAASGGPAGGAGAYLIDPTAADAAVAQFSV